VAAGVAQEHLRSGRCSIPKEADGLVEHLDILGIELADLWVTHLRHGRSVRPIRGFR